jgi:hypothetical protein
MKWFIHLSDGYKSEKLAALRARFGWSHVGRWNTLLEMVAEKMDKTDRHHLTLPLSDWSRTLDLDPRPLLDFLYFLQEHKIGDTRIEITETLAGLYADVTRKLRKDCPDVGRTLITVYVPKLLELRDHYTRKYVQTTDTSAHKVRPKARAEVSNPLPLLKKGESEGLETKEQEAGQSRPKPKRNGSSKPTAAQRERAREIVDWWEMTVRAVLPELGPVGMLTDTLTRHICMRMEEPVWDLGRILDGLRNWEHGRGRTGGDWKVSLSWLVQKPDNVLKVLEHAEAPNGNRHGYYKPTEGKVEV